MTALLILATIAAAVAFSEFSGYWLHMLLHSNKIQWLSYSHMQHHLMEYHPSKPIRLKDVYLSSGSKRANIFGLGMEWVIPILLMLVSVHSTFYAIRLPLMYQLVFTVSALAWSYVLFGYMHDAMHYKKFWMEDNALLKGWYFKIRRFHDIHHYTFTSEGRMPTNFGICFFFFDWIFGTLVRKQEKFNRDGLKASEGLYAFIYS